ncbi:MAG: hypothetical protein JRI66_11275 [Deltaproteobacteria bacterium]|nr:hypothetical protein [Deltaproteobacteria bacterium]
MANTNEQVFAAFRNKQPAKGLNVRSTGDRCYSYGLCIAVWTQCKGRDIVLLNGDRASVTTSSHQSALRSHGLYDHPTTSFSALSAAGLMEQGDNWSHPGKLMPGVEVIDYTPDYHRWHDREPEPCEVPYGATVTKHSDTYYTVHRPGAILFRQTLEYQEVERPRIWTPWIPPRPYKDPHQPSYIYTTKQRALVPCQKYFIASMDEGQYFVSQLPRPVQTVKQAFEALKPALVRQWEQEGREVLRQGEWFFAPVCAQDYGITTKAEWFRQAKAWRGERDHNGRAILPRFPGSNPHTVAQAVRVNGRLLVAGTVRHPQHRTLKLPGICVAIRNLSRGDWSALGSVD